MEKPASGVLINDFGGVISNRSEHIAPEQFVTYENLQTLVPGKLTPRKGIRPIIFTPTISPSSNDCIAMYAFRTPMSESIVWENTNGDLQIGYSPA